MKGKNIEEKTEILLKNLRNLISYNDKEKKVIMKCPVCGVEFEDTVYSSYKRMFLSRSLEKTQEEFYNLTCKNRTCINKYGNTELSKNKQRTTNLEKYGVESVFMLDEVKEKSKKAKIEKYGSFSNMIKKTGRGMKKKLDILIT